MQKLTSVDTDPQETREWAESIEAVVHHQGRERGRYLLTQTLEHAGLIGAVPNGPLVTPYVNSIAASEQPAYPGDLELEQKIVNLLRWNSAAMVHWANKRFDGLGGHISTFASSALLYEVGFNHFFRGKGPTGAGGDAIYYQGHATPGLYARAFLEGRLSADQLSRFRRENPRGEGLSSYPHPRLMPDFWEFPTVSMGLGPINSIYQARFARYLAARGIADTADRHVWAYLGDGEIDEPESLGALSIAAREQLDNLTFIVNCNLQRLDGPVRGNGKVVQELEGIFRGNGWNVIKVLWGPEWDALFAADPDGILRQRMLEVPDGQWQTYGALPGAYMREHFFGADPRLAKLVEHLSDSQIENLRRGGHCHEKVYAAFKAAVEHKGQPTVILAQTVKGWKLGDGFQGVNVAHQKKKFDADQLKEFRDSLGIPLTDEQLKESPLYHPGMNAPEIQYLMERRAALGGPLPKRNPKPITKVEPPAPALFDEFFKGMATGEASTTMVFSRILGKLLRDKNIGKRIVPIIPDEARTFGLDVLFSQVGIYNPHGQNYEPPDKGKLLFYKETKNGQVLEEGINEAGSMASFIAASTSYSTYGEPVIPFYIYYSMFGHQRIGDQVWLTGDSMGRGFLLGATAGRTTLNGEGLQHEDGHSHILTGTVPASKCYDIAFAYELATVIEDGIKAMLEREERVFYYITLQNDDYQMPPMPSGEHIKEGIIKGIYPYSKALAKKDKHVQLLGSSCIMRATIKAAELLGGYGVSADVWGVTSYQLLRNDALSCERWNRLHPESPQRVPYLTEVLAGVEGPFIAASDFLKLQAEQVTRWIPGRFVPMGTEGFGMSDTRESLRRHFEVDAECIVIAALDALRAEGKVDAATVARAIRELGVDPDKADPLDT